MAKKKSTKTLSQESTEQVEKTTDAQSSKVTTKDFTPTQTGASTSNSSTSSPLPVHNLDSVSTGGTSGADESINVGVSPMPSTSINTGINVPTGHHVVTRKK